MTLPSWRLIPRSEFASRSSQGPTARWLMPSDAGRRTKCHRRRMSHARTPARSASPTELRCVVQVGTAMGVGYVRGRAPDHARNVALADALLQGDDTHGVHTAIVVPLAAAHARRRAQKAADVDTSRVQFLTMVRGE